MLKIIENGQNGQAVIQLEQVLFDNVPIFHGNLPKTMLTHVEACMYVFLV